MCGMRNKSARRGTGRLQEDSALRHVPQEYRTALALRHLEDGLAARLHELWHLLSLREPDLLQRAAEVLHMPATARGGSTGDMRRYKADHGARKGNTFTWFDAPQPMVTHRRQRAGDRGCSAECQNRHTCAERAVTSFAGEGEAGLFARLLQVVTRRTSPPRVNPATTGARSTLAE